ncbi:8-amino-7-oxononanoate synthase [Shewanella sp. AS1]|nr:8-amino-7-oxononanoate synthase [Shewanella sp. AS1]MCE9678943.1 8-amino-7-oxononanoate synthase [Shewanella sp. AS1]
MNSLKDKITKQMQQASHAGLLRQRREHKVCEQKVSDQKVSEHKVSEPHASELDERATHANRVDYQGQTYINFSNNDYLGLSQSPDLIEAQYQGAKRYGVGSGASPLVTGYSDAHSQLEQQLCAATGHEAALLFCSGFSANTALMKTLFDKNDLVVADKLIHASLIDGLRDSQARLKRFAHNDLSAAKRLIEQHRPSAVISESVFSMDGDCAPLDRLYRLCRQNGSWLIIDDAHGFGVLGGLGLPKADASNCDIQVVTFGKALGCQGAAILGTQACIDFLVAHARHYIYSTALSPACACVAAKAVELVSQLSNDGEPQLARQLAESIHFFKQSCQQVGIELTDSLTPIQPVLISELARLERVATSLREQGFMVGAIRPPTVPTGSARLRITLNLYHTRQEITQLIRALSRALEQNYATE